MYMNIIKHHDSLRPAEIAYFLLFDLFLSV